MKRCAAILAVLAAAGAASCIVVPAHEGMVYREGPSEGTVVVEQEPPAPQVEVVTVAPSPAYVWVAGYWGWDRRWVWVRWVMPPHPGGVGVGGSWARRGRGWVWVGGYWRH